MFVRVKHIYLTLNTMKYYAGWYRERVINELIRICYFISWCNLNSTSSFVNVIIDANVN